MCSMFAPALSSLAGLVRTAACSHPMELEQVATGIGHERGIWSRWCAWTRSSAVSSSSTRTTGWMRGCSRGCRSGNGLSRSRRLQRGLACVQGGVREDWLRFGCPSSSSSCGRANPAWRTRLHPSCPSLDGEPAVTIHVYSPRLDAVGQYRVDEQGVMRREAAPPDGSSSRLRSSMFRRRRCAV